jgi:hypothetical protein
VDVANNIFMSSTVSDLSTQKLGTSASVGAMKKAQDVQSDMIEGILGDASLNSDVDKGAVQSIVSQATGKGQNLDVMA